MGHRVYSCVIFRVPMTTTYSFDGIDSAPNHQLKATPTEAAASTSRSFKPSTPISTPTATFRVSTINMTLYATTTSTSSPNFKSTPGPAHQFESAIKDSRLGFLYSIEICFIFVFMISSFFLFFSIMVKKVDAQAF